jgi:cyclic pyranopterin phosphate synthase
MQAAARLGMRVKLNMVPLKGLNDNELVPLARFALKKGFHIRFIELMPVGEAMEHTGIPQNEVHSLIEEHFGPLQPVGHKTGNGPAEVFSIPGYLGYIGFIAALSHRFCDACNRVRLTSTGFLKTCLCHGDGVDLRPPLRAGASDEDLQGLIRKAVFAKPKGHTFSFNAAPGSGFFMNSVGG